MSYVVTLQAIPDYGDAGATIILAGQATVNGDPVVGVTVQLWLDSVQLVYVDTDYSGTYLAYWTAISGSHVLQAQLLEGPSYWSPEVYVEYDGTQPPPVSVAFHIHDNVSLRDIAGASVTISDSYGHSLPGVTDSEGRISFTTDWTPYYVYVSASGYYDHSEDILVTGVTIPIGLDPIVVYYDVLIWATPSTGGSVNPSGTVQVQAGASLTVTATAFSGYALDYWLVNDINVGNVNPLVKIIDRWNFSIHAVFKEGTEPPPSPPNGWPHTEQMHFSETLEGGWGLGASRTLVVGPVDMTKILGGRLDVTITYQSYVIPGVTARIHWNGNLVYEGIVPQVPLVVNIDIAQGSIGALNSLKIGFSQGPMSFSVVAFDVWVTLGYSAKPDIDPGINPEEEGWEKYLPYIAIGGGLLLLLLLTRGGKPTVVVVGDKRA